MSGIRIMPIITITETSESSPVLHEILTYLRNDGHGSPGACALHLSAKNLELISDDLLAQLEPFFDSGRTTIFLDGLDSSIHGCMTVRDVEKNLREGIQKLSGRLPGMSLRILPRWHDVQRKELFDLYQNIAQQNNARLLFEGRFMDLPMMYQPFDDRIELFPAILPQTSNELVRQPQQLGSYARLLQKQFNQQISLSPLQTEAASPGAIPLLAWFVPNENPAQVKRFLDSLHRRAAQILGSGETLAPGTSDCYLLDSPSDDIKPLYTAFPAEFGSGDMSPAFTGTLFPNSFTKRLRKSSRSYSPLASHPPPEQRVQNPRPEREITSSMEGAVTFSGRDFAPRFNEGNIRGIQTVNGDFRISSGICSRLGLINAGRKEELRFDLQSAFALNNEASRGLRQTLRCKSEASQVDGWIINDFLQFGDQPELVLDSYIQHPWLREGYEIQNYVPQMIEIWDDIRPEEILTIVSANSDGTSRNMSFAPAEFLTHTRKQHICLFPGMKWILRRGNESLGLELIHGKKQKIDLPSAIELVQAGRNRYTLRFMPTAEYRNVPLELINGLMEHYSLRILAFPRNLDSFGTMPRRNLEMIEAPFVCYY